MAASAPHVYRPLPLKRKTPDNPPLTSRINLHLTLASWFFIPGLSFLLHKGIPGNTGEKALQFQF